MQGSLLANDLRKVISIVDLLRDIGLGSQLSLPKVVVLGTQSSGKSSLLEQIVGLDFLPRGSGVVTRRPLELRMNNVQTLPNPYAEFDQIVEKGEKKKFTNFDEVRKAIDFVTDQVCGKNKQIIDKPIILNIFSKSCPNLTMVDLPGITSIPVGGQAQNIYQITREMALRYINEPRSIILCVVPANQDLATSEALKIMREIDPSGQRSIGCLTKIDIMNRGDDARSVLKNQQIPLRYGYVGIKNRCQEDVNNNVPVEESIKSQKKYFTTSPIYSTLPSDLWGTQSLTKKLTSILYQQIKTQMPEIFEEIKSKKKIAQEELERLGPGVANSDAQLVNYAWKSIATFLRIFKNSLGGIKSSEYSKDPISAIIRQELNAIYQEQYDEAATEDITDKDIDKAMINFPGDSTIPGFPSIDAFLALLNPLLKKLQTPAYQINNKIHEIMQVQVTTIIGDVLSPKYPEFNSRFKDLIKRILDKYRRSLETYLNSMLDSELFYLYTNDINYLIGDFGKPVNEKELKKASQNPLVYELRKRIDAYYKLVVRNLRDLVPKQVFNFLIIKCMRQLEFEAFQFTSDPEKLKDWLNEPAEVRTRRVECIKAIKVFDQSEKRIRMDPDISKLIRASEKESQYYKKFGMKSPQEMREEEEKRKAQHYALIASKAQLDTKPSNKQPQKKPEPPKEQPKPASKSSEAARAANPVAQPNPPTPPVNNPIKAVSPSPIQNPVTKPNPVQNPPVQPAANKQPDFTNFFGKTDPPKPAETKPEVSPEPKRNVLGPDPASKQQPTLNQKDFANFFGTTSGQQPPVAPPAVDPIKNPPPKVTPPVQPTADKPPEEKKKTFNKLFGL